MENLDKELYNIRTAICPIPACGQVLFFRVSASRVTCRNCSKIHTIDRLIEVRTPSSPVDALHKRMNDMMKMGWMGNGHLRHVHRVIDGIASVYHQRLLKSYFERFGVTKDGQVKRLVEMGKSEPINVTLLSDYAFAIREEHRRVLEYGQNTIAPLRMPELIAAINATNGKRKGDVDALVMLYAIGKFARAAAAGISKACVGRYVFSDEIYLRFQDHATKFGQLYKRLSNCFDDHKWAIVEQCCRFDPGEIDVYVDLPLRGIDLAMLANVMYRTILLLDPNNPESVQVFVPFLRKPEYCVDRRGFPRSPLVFCWLDKQHLMKSPMISVAIGDEIIPVRLPRSWFTSVWGHPESEVANEHLSRYLHFDQDNRCLVASGIYFKPEQMKKYATAFEEYALHHEGILPRLVAEYVEDMKPLSFETTEVATRKVLEECVDDRVWRCMLCERLTSSPSPGSVSCGCETMSSKCMRQQRADGTVEYYSGDHTSTPAPNSWCFMKRKHFHHGREYDNPPMKINVNYDADGVKICKTIWWFSGESENGLNSNAWEFAMQLLRKRNHDETTSEPKPDLLGKLQAEIEKQVETTSKIEHKVAHLKESVGSRTFDHLFDDHELPVSMVTPISIVREDDCDKLIADVKQLLLHEETLCESIRVKRRELINKLKESILPDVLQEIQDIEQGLEEIESGVLAQLRELMIDCNDHERWYVLRKEEKLFKQDGLYSSYAERRFKHHEHFQLPLLGLRMFVFNDSNNDIMLCVKRAGHFVVNENVDVIADLCYQFGARDDCNY